MGKVKDILWLMFLYFLSCVISLLANIVAFLIDPVNEVVGLFNGNPARQTARSYRKGELSSSFVVPASKGGFQLGLAVSYRF